MFVNIVTWIFPMVLTLSLVYLSQNRADALLLTVEEKKFEQIGLKSNQKVHLDELENNIHEYYYMHPGLDRNVEIQTKESIYDKRSTHDSIPTTTAVPYFVDSKSSTEENVYETVKNSTGDSYNDIYNVTTKTTMSYFEDSRSSTEKTVDKNDHIQVINTTEDNHNNNYNVTTKTTMSYFEDNRSFKEKTVHKNVNIQVINTTEDNDSVTTKTTTVSTVTSSNNIVNDNKTNITLKDTWIKRRGLFILIPALLVVATGVSALLVLRRVNVLACFNARGSYDVQDVFLGLKICHRGQYDSFQHVQFMPDG